MQLRGCNWCVRTAQLDTADLLHACGGGARDLLLLLRQLRRGCGIAPAEPQQSIFMGAHNIECQPPLHDNIKSVSRPCVTIYRVSAALI